jgi:HK97 family phage major capsid protein
MKKICIFTKLAMIDAGKATKDMEDCEFAALAAKSIATGESDVMNHMYWRDLEAVAMTLPHGLREYLYETKGVDRNASNDSLRAVLTNCLWNRELNPEQLKTLCESQPMSTVSDVLNAAAGSNPTVKKPSEMYSKAATNGLHTKTGKPVMYRGTAIMEPSELAMAKVGTWFKHFVGSGQHPGILHGRGASVPRMSDHERALLEEMLHTDKWCGDLGNKEWCEGRTIAELGLNTKALLNDATSGGQNLVPFEFDAAVITYALLSGEIFPYIDLRECGRDEVQTADIDNVSVQWGTGEGSEISVFDTDDMIGNITATVHPATAAIEYGRDLAADSPVAIGSILTQQLGQAFLKEFDDVIINGTGSQPEGILNAVSLAGVNSDNDTAGPPTLNDYLSLQFAIGKQYRRRELNPCFITNDTTYQRSRSIKVSETNPTTDQRPVFGLDQVNSYMTLDWPHRINNKMPNSSVIFGCMKAYRLWRRSGFEFRLVTEDKELALKNKNLIIARARMAGKVVNPEAFAVMADAQS